MKEAADINVRAPAYFVARTEARCPHCGRDTSLVAIVLPPTHEVRDPDSGVWQCAGGHAFLFHLAFLPDSVVRRLEVFSARFQPLPGAMATGGDWVNHCAHCDAPLEDQHIHCEPGVAFMPSSAAEAGSIELWRIDAAFEAQMAGYALEPAFFQSMRMLRKR